ncbi:hypothetical protein NDU88_002298 [Pleurodeles waltl]|uniref:Uncharacterized protein n=1 Tax=Pleurodeles waltl TaxID=8319 RepID=A0AAV7TMU4_PLEWA|nr:hypothetical protein NDU88_002298 [Pleurodeles waltl]
MRRLKQIYATTENEKRYAKVLGLCNPVWQRVFDHGMLIGPLLKVIKKVKAGHEEVRWMPEMHDAFYKLKTEITYSPRIRLRTDALQAITKNSMVPFSKPSHLLAHEVQEGEEIHGYSTFTPKAISPAEEALFINGTSMIGQETGVDTCGEL